MRTRSMSYAKNFVIVGLVLSPVECNIESLSDRIQRSDTIVQRSNFNPDLKLILEMEATLTLSTVLLGISR